MRKAVDSEKSLNDREAKSAILFLSPSIYTVVRGEAWHVIILSANIRSSLAVFVALVDKSLDAHATVGVLSHQHATWA